MQTQTKDMTKGKPGRLILSFALPLMLGNMFQQAYTMVDTIVVGQVVGVHALAAVGSTDWFNWMSLGLCSGLTQGFSILIAQQFGAKEIEKMKRTIGVSLVLSIISALVVMTLFLSLSRPVMVLMGTREEILGDALIYLRIMFGGILIVMTYNWMSAVLRAIGDSTTPLIAMGVASVTNIVLDIVFVAGFHWGIAGAAVATLIGQMVSCLYCFQKMRRIEVLSISKSDLVLDKQLSARIFRLGSPVAFQNVIISVGGMILQSIINSFGVIFVAGYTATNKLYGILEIAAISFGFAVSTYTGQNKGAREHERIRVGVKEGAVMAVLTAAAISLIMIVFGKLILGLFIERGSAEAGEVMGYAYDYLFTMAIFLPILYCLHIYRSALQGMGNTTIPMASGIVEFFMRIGAAVFLPGIIGEFGVYYAEILAWIGAAILLFFSYQKDLRKIGAGQVDIPLGK